MMTLAPLPYVYMLQGIVQLEMVLNLSDEEEEDGAFIVGKKHRIRSKRLSRPASLPPDCRPAPLPHDVVEQGPEPPRLEQGQRGPEAVAVHWRGVLADLVAVVAGSLSLVWLVVSLFGESGVC